MGPAMRMQKKSNALRSVSVMVNDSIEGGGDGVTTGVEYRLTVSACDDLVPEDTSSSLFADGLLDAGNSRRDSGRLPSGNAS